LTAGRAGNRINNDLYKCPLKRASAEHPNLSPSPARIRGTVASVVDQPDDLRQIRLFHLGKLRTSGIVTTARAGRETICSLRPSAFAEAAIQERDVLGVAPSR
jgi:hypothetical protein